MDIIFNDFSFDMIKDITLNEYYQDILLKLAIFSFVLLITLLLRHVISKMIDITLKRILTSLDIESDGDIQQSLNRPLYIFSFIFIYYITITILSDNLTFLDNMMRAVTVFISYWIMSISLIPLLNRSKLSKIVGDTFFHWSSKIIKVLLFCFTLVVIFEIWGIKVLPLIASFGIIGVAVALGAQDLFKNLIAGLVNITEGRFHVGDIININGIAEGTVENIGFRSTLVRRFDMIPVHVPNALLSEGALDNYTKRPHRRIWWEIGIEYGTSQQIIEKIITEIYDYIHHSDDFVYNDELDHQVVFDKFSASSMDILIICYTSQVKWQDYLNAKERLAYAIMNILEHHHVSFAFPSQTIYVKNDNEQSALS